jgi:hypothetical protein
MYHKLIINKNNMNTTYEKVSETEIKIITNTPKEEIISLSDIKRDLQNAQDGMVNLLKKHQDEINELNSYIAKLESTISEAVKLDVKEKK